MYPNPRSHRPLIMGRNGAVGANHPLATQAGLDTLRAGGNAVDAAVAIALALGVVEPMMSGPRRRRVLSCSHRRNGRGAGLQRHRPRAARRDAGSVFADGMAVRGPRSVSVPGSLAGARRDACRARPPRPGPQLVAPAIEHAREGFAATHGYRHFAADEPRHAGRRCAQPRRVPRLPATSRRSPR